MYNIKTTDLEKFADHKVLKYGEQLANKNFFPIKNLQIKDNPNRFDTKVYSIEWKEKDYYWYSFRATIEVDVEDNIIGFYSNCICDKAYNKMCEHLVCLGYTIKNKIENEKKEMGAEEYQNYEGELLHNFEKRKADYLEKLRADQIKLNKKNFSVLLADYDILNKKVILSQKIGLEVTIIYDRNYTMTLRIGANKKYVIKNIYEFLLAIKNRQLIKYGKELEFYHDIDNFDDSAKIIINLLLNKTSYWLEAAYKYDLTNHFRYLNMSNVFFEEFLSSYVNNHFILIYSGIEKQLYISDRSFEGKLYLDEEKIVLKDVKNYRLFIGENKNFILIDSTIYQLNGVSEVLKPIYKQLSQNKEVIIKDTFNIFLKEIYPIIYNEVEVEYSFKEKHPVKHVKIDSYFDLDNGTLEVKTKYFLGDKETNIDSLTKGIYSYSKFQEYQRYLDSFGFINGKTSDIDRITLFLKSDLSVLKKYGDVYLSETIKRTQIKTMHKVVVNLSYNVDIFSVCFNDLGFSDEELAKIISEFRKKKKYVKLNDDVIVEINEKIMNELVEVVDDLNLNEKRLNRVQEKPLYIAAKLFQKQNNEHISFNYNEHLKEIINKIKNYKDNNYSIPVSLKKVLRHYQVDAFKWLKTLTEYNFGGILADDMGLGKTLEIISFILSDEKDMPSLIICPTSLIYNWKSEILKWAESLEHIIITGSINERMTLIENISNKKIIYITSYDTFKNDVQLYEDKNFRFVILDEAQFIKNYYTLKAKAVKEIKSEVRFVLTGTPIENSLLDLWSIFDFLLPGYLSNHSNFRQRYEKSFINNENQEINNELIKKITPFVLRRTKKSVLKDLPNKFETISFAQMDTEQRKVYEAYLLSTRNQLKEGRTKFEILSSLTRLRQICVDPGIFLENYQGKSAKVELAMEIIYHSIENNHKILLFSQFTSLFPILEKNLKDNDINYYILTGQTKALDRIQMVDDFNENEDIKVFLISLKAGGTGLNLVGADIVIHFDPWWNISVENQATDRAHRIGQKRSVQVIKLVCEDSIEQKVIELQTIKKDLADRIISDDDGNIQKLDESDLKYLLS